MMRLSGFAYIFLPLAGVDTPLRLPGFNTSNLLDYRAAWSLVTA